MIWVRRLTVTVVLVALTLGVTACGGGTSGGSDQSRGEPVFAQNVLPVLRANCSGSSCHSDGAPAAVNSGFVLKADADQTYQGIVNAQDLVSPGDRDVSELYTVVERWSPIRMPPAADLRGAADADTIGGWIDDGALDYDLTGTGSKPTGYVSADGVNGARLYSKFWAVETGFTLANSGLADQEELDNVTDNSNFFRCKQCHGWDRLGRVGGYIDRGPKTSRPNVAGLDLVVFAADSTEQQVFDAIKAGSGAARRAPGDDLSGYDPDTNSTAGDRMPDYGAILTDAQIWDVVKFLEEEALDTTELYELRLIGTYPTGSRTFHRVGNGGDRTFGDALYASRCATCHGSDGAGTAQIPDIDGGHTLGEFVRTKPYETQHKVKFGNVGSIMPSGLVTDSSDVRDLFLALTDPVKYPDPGVTIPAGLKGSDGLNGGRLYSKFWADETGFGAGQTAHDGTVVTQSDVDDEIDAFSNFFRCKQCHGWDRLGRTGAYVNRAPQTLRPNVADLDLVAFASSATPQQLFDAIAETPGGQSRRDFSADLSAYDPDTNATVGDTMPDYGSIFTDTQIWDLVRYLQYDGNDTTELYAITTTGTYPTGSRTFSALGGDAGDSTNGSGLFAAKCAVCHGAEGTGTNLVTIVDDGEVLSVGQFARNSPYEVQHKVKFGHLGSIMPAGLMTDSDDIADLFKALSEVDEYPDPTP